MSTVTLSCDNCGLMKSIDAKYSGRRVKCPHCSQTVEIRTQSLPQVPISSPFVEAPPLIDTSRSTAGHSTSRRPKPNSNKKLILVSGACGLAGAILMATLGLFLSQYWPVFGGVLEKGFGQPWSPARTSLIPIHIFVFSLTGLILGTVVGAAFVTLVASNKGGT